MPPGTYVLTLGQITIDKNLAIEGSDTRTTIIDGNDASRIFETAPGTQVVFRALTLTRGNAAGDGGAVLSQGAALVQFCTVKDNTASGEGGGVAAGGDLSVDFSTFSGNRAFIGGAIVRVAPSDQTISNSTFSGNVAQAFGGAWTCGNGAFPGTLDLLNSTFTGNEAGSVDALDLGCDDTVTTVANTIFAENGSDAVQDCAFAGGSNIETTSHVLGSDGSCTLGGPGDLPNTDALLGPLANNGFFTDTHLPGAGSPAIDAGDAAVCDAAPVGGQDQRFVFRPQGAGCDIGSVEVEVIAAPDDDGVANDVDNCPTVANPGQQNFDNDAFGDACDNDLDNDGKTNNHDVCDFTPAGQVVGKLTGCSIAELCPCDGPLSSHHGWHNHAQYVSCVTVMATAFRLEHLITTQQKVQVINAAAQSSCGR